MARVKIFFCFFLLYSPFLLATPHTLNINSDQIINTPTVYQNTTLNMSAGFIIVDGGSLSIENSNVNFQPSTTHPFFTYMKAGSLNLKNNIVKVNATLVVPANTVPHANLIKIDHGLLNLDHNYFIVNIPHTTLFLTTNQDYATSGFQISSNTIENFQGGIYLSNSYAAHVYGNTLNNIGLNSIMNVGDANIFCNNIINLAGYPELGNAFEIVNSEHLSICNNVIAGSANYGIHIKGGKNLTIDNNKIMDSFAFGIFIEPYLENNDSTNFSNKNITITNNYFGLNRYGISASEVNSLSVYNNIFLQKFEDAVSRKHWTDNSQLLIGVINLNWSKNLYKEAYTQEVPGNNALAKQFVEFPISSGVAL